VQGLGVLTVAAVERAACRAASQTARVAVGAVLVVTAWTSLTQFHHLDDALALSASACGLWCLRARHDVLAGLLLGLAAASKPWAVVALPLVLAAASPAGRLRAGAAAVVAATVIWVPFVLADPRTFALAEVGLPVDAGSALNALHAGGLAGFPERLRVLQFAAGGLVTAGLVLRGAWPLALLTAFAARLLLEPSTYRYYDVGLITAAFIADTHRRGRVPVLTLVTVAAWLGAGTLPAHAAASVRAATYGSLLVMGLLALLPRGRTLARRSEAA
jgi:hypothetical protein